MTGLCRHVGVLIDCMSAMPQVKDPYIDVALLDVQVAALANQALNALVQRVRILSVTAMRNQYRYPIRPSPVPTVTYGGDVERQ
ncbi:hypothetical protein DSL92_05545 [Billgrantia gudaonensis]|uniref:Uncharacterized protein n=1 Tax=Billgrantia gudaonensis TaxID=376427 RepID=A0A432JJ18_9GAMM|nr:hypothetical protein DSL92_05545 [Halomonas gudaonensis]